MTVAETISKKITRMPIQDQRQVLELIREIESRRKRRSGSSPNDDAKHILSKLAEMAVDMGVTDLADRHDFYAHGKLED